MNKFRTSACHDKSGYYGLMDWVDVRTDIPLTVYVVVDTDVDAIACISKIFKFVCRDWSCLCLWRRYYLYHHFQVRLNPFRTLLAIG